MFFGASKYNYMNLEMKLSTTAHKVHPVSFEQEEGVRKMRKMESSDILISNIKVRKEAESAYQNNVYFRDPLNGAYVNVGLI